MKRNGLRGRGREGDRKDKSIKKEEVIEIERGMWIFKSKRRNTD